MREGIPLPADANLILAKKKTKTRYLSLYNRACLYHGRTNNIVREVVAFL